MPTQKLTVIQIRGLAEFDMAIKHTLARQQHVWSEGGAATRGVGRSGSPPTQPKTVYSYFFSFSSKYVCL
jgi:hypothetical protein